MGPDGDQDLERRVREDPSAFATLYELNHRRILNYILYCTGDVETALDLTSETFFKALRALPRYRCTGAPFSAWLFKIASREVAMNRRRARLAKVVPLLDRSPADESERVRGAVYADEITRARDELEHFEGFDSFCSMLRSLPRGQRQVLFLRYFEDMSNEEIASVLGIPTGTVKSRMNRALERLRAGMEPGRGEAHFNKRGLETSPEMRAVPAEEGD